jgi:hypothetical protein
MAGGKNPLYEGPLVNTMVIVRDRHGPHHLRYDTGTNTGVVQCYYVIPNPNCVSFLSHNFASYIQTVGSGERSAFTRYNTPYDYLQLSPRISVLEYRALSNFASSARKWREKKWREKFLYSLEEVETHV